MTDIIHTHDFIYLKHIAEQASLGHSLHSFLVQAEFIAMFFFSIIILLI